MFRIIAAFIAAGAILVAATTLFSREPEVMKDKDKAQDRMEILTMWKMIEALDLDQATADKILAIRHKFLSQRKLLRKDLSEDFRALRKQLNHTPKSSDDEELARILHDIRSKREQLEGLRFQQYDDVSKVLTVRQRARLVLFFRDFHKQLHSLLHPSRCPSGTPEKDMGPTPKSAQPPEKGAMPPH